MSGHGPRRIVCLSTETVDTLYRLGLQSRIVGISGFTVHPPQARREKPRISAYTTAKLDAILALAPDLVLGFSDLQAELAAALIRAGLEVHIFNQRSIAGILASVRTLGRLVDAAAPADRLASQVEAHLEALRQQARPLPRRPRVYFEEWDDPPMCGIRWVSELIELVGGEDVFADLAQAPGAAGRILPPADEVAARAPELIIGSWCGKKVRPGRVAERPGWAGLPAVTAGRLYEIKSADILQPGIIALTRGADQLATLIRGRNADSVVSPTSRCPRHGD